MTTCALVAASDFNADHFMALYKQDVFDQVMAVDAGFAYLDELGVKPDLAIGDFDSLGYVPKARRVSRHPAHKDASDLELALQRAASREDDHLYIYGALGRRLDHTVANLQLFAYYAELGFDITVIDMNSALRVLVGPDAFELPRLESGIVSVFSATDRAIGVSERGLEYSLDDAELTNRTSLGLSNELIGQEAVISVAEGTLYVFYPLDIPADDSCDSANADERADVDERMDGAAALEVASSASDDHRDATLAADSPTGGEVAADVAR